MGMNHARNLLLVVLLRTATPTCQHLEHLFVDYCTQLKSSCLCCVTHVLSTLQPTHKRFVVGTVHALRVVLVGIVVRSQKPKEAFNAYSQSDNVKNCSRSFAVASRIHLDEIGRAHV